MPKRIGPMTIYIKYKEGNDRSSSVNPISLVHKHEISANKRYTQDNTDTRENPSDRNQMKTVGGLVFVVKC